MATTPRYHTPTGPCPTARSKPQSSSPTPPGARSTHSDPPYFAGNVGCDTVLPSVIPSDHLIASKYIVRMSGSVEVPDLRIVSDQQWERVQTQIKRNREIFGGPRLGGMSRTAQCRDYLFSGLLMCAICGYRMVIVGRSGKYASYGCPVHRFKSACPSRLQIRHDRRERQLLKHPAESVLRPDMLECTILEFQDRIERTSAQFIESQKRAQAELPKMKV